MMALREAARAGLLGRAHWQRNLAAGVVVGVVALPLAMAFAIASGVPPAQGIYTAIVAGIIVSIFGGSRIQIAGPTGAFVVILAGITAQYGIDGLLLATMMAGLMLIFFGLARFGRVLRFIPAPVIVGFTAGIGVIIFVGQWQAFLGLPETHGDHFHEQLAALVQVLPSLHPATMMLGLVSLVLVLYGSRLPGCTRIPGPLLAMVVATLAQSLFTWDGVATIDSAFGGIPRTLPPLGLPTISADRIITLLPSAFAIALLGAIESLLSAVVADGMAGTQHDSNQELIGQGLANLIAPLIGGFAATGAIARTATNFRNGANSPLAGIVHSLLLLMILLVLAPLAGRIPLAALAAILFVVAWNMSDVPRMSRILRTAPGADVAILLITFFLTVLVDLVVAVNVGVILAMLLFLRRMAATVDVLPTPADAAHADGFSIPDEVLVYTIDGPFFFAAVETFQHALQQIDADPRGLILRLHRVPFIDITAMQALEEAINRLERRGVRVLLCGARQNVLRKLVRAGLVRRTQNPPRYFAELGAALTALQASTTPLTTP